MARILVLATRSHVEIFYDFGFCSWSAPLTETEFVGQIKDVALKASGAYRNCKPCSGSNSNHRHNYADSDTASDSARFQCSYRRAGSATPWLWSKEVDTRMKVLSSGETTPASVSGRPEPVVFMEEDEPKEWVAQVEPGVLITFVSLPQGGNDLKRIRFRYLNCFFLSEADGNDLLFSCDYDSNLLLIIGLTLAFT